MAITKELGAWIDAAWKKARLRHYENQAIEPDDFFTVVADATTFDVQNKESLGLIRKALDCSPTRTLSEAVLESKISILNKIISVENSLQDSINRSKSSLQHSAYKSRRGMRAGFRFLNKQSGRRSAAVHEKMNAIRILVDGLNKSQLSGFYLGLSIITAIVIGGITGLILKP